MVNLIRWPPDEYWGTEATLGESAEPVSVSFDVDDVVFRWVSLGPAADARAVERNEWKRIAKPKPVELDKGRRAMDFDR